MANLLFLFMALCASLKNAIAIKYSSGGTTVDVSLELVDENNSTKVCVDYLTGDNYNRDYDKACFTSFFTDGGTFRLCEVQFGDKTCVRCDPCTISGKVGYEIDCFNIQPSENTNGCVELNDMNIQKVLVDNEFDGVNLLYFNITEGEEGEEASPSSALVAFSLFSSLVGTMVAAALVV